EGGKAEAEDRAKVGVADVGEDALLEAAGGLERLADEEAPLQLGNVDGIGIGNRRIELAKSGPEPLLGSRALGIVVKTLAVLPAQSAALVHELVDHLP